MCLCVCVYYVHSALCTCMCAYMCMYACLCAHVEARGDSGVLCYYSLPNLSETRSLTALAQDGGQRTLVILLQACHCVEVTGTHAQFCCFNVRAGNLNSGFHAYTEKALIHKLPPQAPNTYFYLRLLIYPFIMIVEDTLCQPLASTFKFIDDYTYLHKQVHPCIPHTITMLVL